MAEHRVTLRFSDDDYMMLQHWAKKKDMPVSEFVREAIQFRINWFLKDYELAPLEVQRLNQIVDIITTLTYNVASLEGVITSGFDSLLGLTRGDNYLLDEDGGDM